MNESGSLWVSLIMPVRNEAEQVNATMAAVMASTRIPDEIVIADGMSDDATRNLFEAWLDRGAPVRVVDNPKRFSGSGRNLGAAASRGDVLVFADCGNPISREWLDEMVRPFAEHPAADIVCGVFEPQVTSEFEHCVACIHYPTNYRMHDLDGDQQQALEPTAILPGGGAIAMRRSTFDSVGGYPEWLHRAQDKLFSRKSYALGKRVFVSWKARMAHHMRSTVGEIFQLTFDYGRGNGRTRFLNMHFVKLAAFYGLIGVLLVLGSVGYPACFPAAGLLLAGYYWHAGLRKIIARDGRIGSFRLAWYALLILFPRDMGVLTGHLVGAMEWLLLPQFRSAYHSYMAECDPGEIVHFED